MKLNQDTSELKNYGGEKFERTDNYQYGDLYGLIDVTRKKINYLKNVYSSELNGIPKRKNSLKTNVTYNIVFLIIVSLFLTLYLKVVNAGGGMLLHSVEGWVALAALWFAVIFMLIRCGKFIFIFCINVIPDKMNGYIIKHNIHTLVEEKEYCETVLKNMLSYEETLRHIEKEMKKETAIVEEAQKTIYSMKLDVKDFKYNAGKIFK